MSEERKHPPIPKRPDPQVTTIGGDVKGWFVIVVIPFCLMGIALLLAIASRISN